MNVCFPFFGAFFFFFFFFSYVGGVFPDFFFHSNFRLSYDYLLGTRFFFHAYLFSLSTITFTIILENRGEFLEKLQKVRSLIKPTTHTQPILSRAGNARLVVGNWSLLSRKEGEITIHNADGQQVILICIRINVIYLGDYVLRARL